MVTQPDRPAGRRRKPTPCPVREKVGPDIPVLTPERVGSPEIVDRIHSLAPDLGVVVDYGQFIPKPVREAPRWGMLNIHPSLLPRYRGAAPVPWAIANGDDMTGVSVLYVTAHMDAGNILLQEPAPIRPDDTTPTLAPRLAEQGADLLERAFDLFRGGHPPEGRPQDESKATLAPKLKKEDGRVDWTWPAVKIRDRVRAFQPWPGCFIEAPAGSGRTLRLIEVVAEEGAGEPGLLIPADGGDPCVATGTGVLRLVTVQPQGRNPMPGHAWARGYLRGESMRLG